MTKRAWERRPGAQPCCFNWAACVTCIIAAGFPVAKARADNPLRLYVGAAIGQARVEANAPYVPDFSANHSAYKVQVGTRPIPWIGAEIEYADFGHPSQLNGFFATDVRMKGAAAFGLLFLPVPIVDIYGKVGAARLQSTTTTSVVCPPSPCPEIASPAPVRRTNSSFAAGAGAQFKVGALAVRGEYERFNAAGGNPGLFSLGATWTF